MEKFIELKDFADQDRQAFVAKISSAEDQLKKNRAAVAADNQNGLRLNWFCNNFKPSFRGL
jgi:hypothetical protein